MAPLATCSSSEPRSLPYRSLKLVSQRQNGFPLTIRSNGLQGFGMEWMSQSAHPWLRPVWPLAPVMLKQNAPTTGLQVARNSAGTPSRPEALRKRSRCLASE